MNGATRALVQCPNCGRWLRPRVRGGWPAHYNPANPPELGAWSGCPGPTADDKRRAAQYRVRYSVKRGLA